MASLLSLVEAQQIVLSAVNVGPTVRLPLRSAVGHVLAEPLACDMDYPPFDRSMMDGYAVRASDVSEVPTQLIVVGHVGAGSVADKPVSPGEAVQINTGAPIPSGADAVVRVEDTETAGNEVTIRVRAEAGLHVAQRGKCVRAGQTVLEAGSRLGPGQIAVAASAGHAAVTVYRQPSVGIMATGDELVEPEYTPAGGQIRDSNRYVLDGLIRQANGRPVDLGVAPDQREALTERIRAGLNLDCLCISGGVSMGTSDFVPECLAECGAEIRFHRIALKPGKPTLFATCGKTCIFGLPGNPVSVFAVFCLLVKVALAKRQGVAEPIPKCVTARLGGPIAATGARLSYRPARVGPDNVGSLVAEPIAWQGSGDPFGLAAANALIETQPHTDALKSGQEVRVLIFEAW